MSPQHQPGLLAQKEKPAMSTKKPAASKPAKPAKGSKPAAAHMSLKDIAAKVGKDPKAVRARIRKAKGGAQVGQGGRYSFTAKEAQEILALFG